MGAVTDQDLYRNIVLCKSWRLSGLLTSGAGCQHSGALLRHSLGALYKKSGCAACALAIKHTQHGELHYRDHQQR